MRREPASDAERDSTLGVRGEDPRKSPSDVGNLDAQGDRALAQPQPPFFGAPGRLNAPRTTITMSKKSRPQNEFSWCATAGARLGFCRAKLERATALSENASSVFCKFSASAPGEKPRPGEVELGSKATRGVGSRDPARAEADGSPTSNRLPTTYCAVQCAGHKSLARVGQQESLGRACQDLRPDASARATSPTGFSLQIVGATVRR